jgi:TRAP-type C4-dicarboxylate transport system substrate-binding protein
MCLFAVVILSTGCRSFSTTNTLKLAHGLDVSHPVHEGMVFMAEEVSRISNGNLEIEIYPNGQLGSERQCLELLQIGSLDITKVSVAVMENFAPNLKVLGLPYIFRNQDHVWQVLLGNIGKELLKIRVMNSQTAMQMVKALGGAPTPISWGELYTALQQGVVDGAENNPPSFYTSHHYEVCKFYSLDEHTSVPDILLISTTAWNNLSKKEQSWLQEAADAAVPVQRKLWKEAEQLALEEVQKAGVEISYPDKSIFSSKVAEIYESYRTEPEVYDLIQRITKEKNLDK